MVRLQLYQRQYRVVRDLTSTQLPGLDRGEDAVLGVQARGAGGHLHAAGRGGHALRALRGIRHLLQDDLRRHHPRGLPQPRPHPNLLDLRPGRDGDRVHALRQEQQQQQLQCGQ